MELKQHGCQLERNQSMMGRRSFPQETFGPPGMTGVVLSRRDNRTQPRIFNPGVQASDLLAS
jgi:hypothetical protein